MSNSVPSSFPNFTDKHSSDPLFTPEEAIKAVVAATGRIWEVPEGIILVYQNSLLRYLGDRPGGAVEPVELPIGGGVRPKSYVINDRVGVLGGFGIGAPVAAMVTEELIALGCNRILNIGAAGGLQPDLGPGAIALCSAAVRDEGVSHHYIPSARFAKPSLALSEVLEKEIRARGVPYRVGPTWTIDAVYRETVAEAAHYRSEGVLTVEMEAAAVLAVAEHRGVEAAAAFVVGDVLGETEWEPEGIWAADTHTSLGLLLEASIAALA